MNSVIIPTFNCGRFVAGAIESALGQTVRPAEVVVIDDGSTDDTESVIRQFGDKVTYIKQSNAGVSAARNRGVAESSSEFIAFLDADDIWEPTKLEKQLAVFESDPEIGLVHCGMREFDSETGETIGLRTDGKDGWVADDLLLWEGPVVNASGSSPLVRRSAFESTDGFDPAIKVGEDWDLCYRIARKYKIGFVREPLVNYRLHPGGAHRNVENMEIGMGRFYEKAFDTDDANVLTLRRRAMSNYHRTLSGSYLYAGSYGRAIKHAVKSLVYRPSSIGYFAKTPLRLLSRS